MKIAIIADPIDNQRGGVHVYTRELVHALLAYDQHNEYILVREQHDPGITNAEQLVVPNYRVGLGLSALRLFGVVPWMLARRGVDAVLEPAHFGPFNLPRRIKRITMIHDLTPILLPEYHRWHSQLLQRWFLGGILKRADLVLSNSQSTTRDLHQHYPVTKDKTATVLLGIDHTDLPEPVGEGALPQIGVDAPFWLYVGTIEPRKNLVRLLEAYRLFRESRAERVQLVIAGQRGWKSEAFYDALERHPFRADIVLPGFVPAQTLSQLYAHAIGLVYPSIYEGFGFPVLEAFSRGCLVVCADNSSLPEVGGDVAFYCQAETPTSIHQQMQRLYALVPAERNQKKIQARHWARQFTWQQHAAQFIQHLTQL